MFSNVFPMERCVPLLFIPSYLSEYSLNELPTETVGKHTAIFHGAPNTRKAWLKMGIFYDTSITSITTTITTTLS